MNRFAEILDVIKIERAIKDNGVHLPMPLTGVMIGSEQDFKPLVDLLNLYKWNKSVVGRLLNVSNVAVGQWVDGKRRLNWAIKQRIINVLKDQGEQDAELE